MTEKPIATPILGLQYIGTSSEGDLKERYGYLNQVGGVVGYKTSKNWYVGLSGNFIFGNQIRLSHRDLFHHLMDSGGLITAENGTPADVVLFSRGLHANIEIGKVLHQLGHNQNSGLFVKLGGGYLNHKIRVETNNDLVPLLERDYRKGYDRYTAGFNLSQFVGYLFMSNKGFLNFYAGFFIQEGFTYNKRKIFFDKPEIPVPTKQRMDILTGFQVGWLIPIYKREVKDYYYN